MATVINLDEWRAGSVMRKSFHGESAKILLFTGVRFERLDATQPQDGNPDKHAGDDHTLRNRAG
jgi:hypothetical protein